MSDEYDPLDGCWDLFEWLEKYERRRMELARRERVHQDMMQRKKDRANLKPIRVIIKPPVEEPEG